jgi:hypothetical protein
MTMREHTVNGLRVALDLDVCVVQSNAPSVISGAREALVQAHATVFPGFVLVRPGTYEAEQDDGDDHGTYDNCSGGRFPG